MLRTWLICVIGLSLATSVYGQEGVDSVPTPRPNFFTRIMEKFDNYDTIYIEPNRYSWATMLQGNTSFEQYTLRSNSADQSLTFNPRPGFVIGPYIGWKFLFIGYTIDVTQMGQRKRVTSDFDFSFYTSRIGFDILYRHTGDNYRLRTGRNFVDAGGAVKVSVAGFNTYYIWNYKHFSYPAAMSQSTVQRRSAGSFMFGASITKHSLDFNYQQLSLANGISLDGNLCFNNLKYTDYNLSAGYGYNWVFKRNWLLCVSAMPAIGYKHLSGDYLLPTDMTPDDRNLETRIGNTLNFDLTARASIVWNTSHYFGGLALVLRSYRYRHDNLVVNNTFGTVSLYVGLNFIRKKN